MQTAISLISETTVEKQLTMSEVATVLRATTQTIRKRLKDQPDFPRPARCGRRLLFSASEVSAYIARQRGEAARA